MKRADASQQQKHASFKRAFETISSYKIQKNYLAAYVVTFSVIEDRIRALYVTWYRENNGGIDPSHKKIYDGFTRLVVALRNKNLIPPDLSILLIEEAKRRNSLMHAAMWNLDGFTVDLVDAVMNLARAIDKTVRNTSKQPKKEI